MVLRQIRQLGPLLLKLCFRGALSTCHVRVARRGVAAHRVRRFCNLSARNVRQVARGGYRLVLGLEGLPELVDPVVGDVWLQLLSPSLAARPVDPVLRLLLLNLLQLPSELLDVLLFLIVLIGQGVLLLT